MRFYQVCYLVVLVMSGIALAVNAPDTIQTLALVLFLVAGTLLAVSIPFEKRIQSLRAKLQEDDKKAHW